MKIAICDDSLEDRLRIKNLCHKAHLIDNVEYKLFDSGKTLLETIKSGEKFDIVFLDIDMPEINGIETGKILNRISPLAIIIFITSYPEYAVESYDCQAFHYFLKPFDDTRFFTVFERALNRLGIIHQYHVIKRHGLPIKILISDIYYIEYSRKHVIYHMKNESIEVVDNLSNVYDQLSPYGFIQIHQGYIVNMDKISKLTKDTVILQNSCEVPMSVRKKQYVVIEYSKYLTRYT